MGKALQAEGTAQMKAWMHGGTRRTPSSIVLLEGEHEQGKKGRGEGVMSLRAESTQPSRDHRPYQVSAFLSVLLSFPFALTL